MRQTIKALEHRQQLLRPWPQQLLTKHFTKGKGNKGKHELLGIHQGKKLCTAKETFNKTKGSLQNGRRYLIMGGTSDKGLVSELYKELINSTPTKQITQLRNGKKT